MNHIYHASKSREHKAFQRKLQPSWHHDGTRLRTLHSFRALPNPVSDSKQTSPPGLFNPLANEKPSRPYKDVSLDVYKSPD